MSKTVYIKLRQLTKTNKTDVYLSDIADVYADKKQLARIKSIKLADFYKVKKGRACVNIMQIITCISQIDDTLDVNSVGESDAVIEYRKYSQPAWINIILTALVCILIFIGSAYAIMAYNNDVSTVEIFEKIYLMAGADNYSEYNVIEIAYAVGLFVGIAVFYDHFMGHKLSKAPTPIEVAMNQYVKDENQTLIDSYNEMPKAVRNHYDGVKKC